MNLKFWKKKTGGEVTSDAGASAGTPDTGADRQEGQESELSGANTNQMGGTPIQQLAARIKLRFAAFMQYFRKPPEFRAGEDHAPTEPGGPDAPPEGEPGEEPTAAAPPRSRKRLAIAAAVGLLLVLLAVMVIVNWPTPDSPQEAATAENQESAKPAATPATLPEPASAVSQTEAPAGEPLPATPRLPARSLPYSAISGEATVGNEDPKAAAMSLKEAIEAMNAATGDYREKPAK